MNKFRRALRLFSITLLMFGLTFIIISVGSWITGRYELACGMGALGVVFFFLNVIIDGSLESFQNTKEQREERMRQKRFRKIGTIVFNVVWITMWGIGVILIYI